MYSKEIIIPDDYEIEGEKVHVKNLSDYPMFDSKLIGKKIILDKQIPGCGATEFYLRQPNVPVILTAPLNPMLDSKLNDDPTDEEIFSGNYIYDWTRRNKVFYFKRNDKTTLAESLQQLNEYVLNTKNYPNFVPKIMVTYESFSNVCELLFNLGCLNEFTIIVDEFPSIFEYVSLPKKGHRFQHFLSLLDALDNRIVFISATVVDKKYLSNISVFKHIPYYTLKWSPQRIQKVRNYPQLIRSIREQMLEIVTNYRANNGIFKSLLNEKGEVINSTEGVFYLNSVVDIVKVINACRLTSKEVKIIIAPNEKNERELKKIDPSLGIFKIGRPCSRSEYSTSNKPFTFVTSVAFLGMDMYSDCSSTYVFSNGNVSSLSLDISIDLPQIAGRCRTEQPFKDDVDIFYIKTAKSLIDGAIAKRKLKEQETQRKFAAFKDIEDMDVLSTILDLQEVKCYKDNYLDVEDLGNGKGRVKINEIAHQADIRAIDIKKDQYSSGYTMYRYVDRTTQSTITDAVYAKVYDFFRDYTSKTDFVSKMKLYAETVSQDPEIKSYIEQHLTIVEIKYKQYYNSLGYDELKRCGFRECDIKRSIGDSKLVQNCTSCVLARCYELMPKGSKISKADVKRILFQIYAEYGLNKTAKSTDLQEWGISFKEIKISQNNKRVDGYEIL